MSHCPAELKYAETHEWSRLEDGVVTVGITDHAQDALGDLIFVELPAVGDQFTAGQELAVVESVKTASDIHAPVTGEIVAVNEAVVDKPELVNEAPYGGGWLFKIKPSNPAQLDDLMSAEQYAASNR